MRLVVWLSSAGTTSSMTSAMAAMPMAKVITVPGRRGMPRLSKRLTSPWEMKTMSAVTAMVEMPMAMTPKTFMRARKTMPAPMTVQIRSPWSFQKSILSCCVLKLRVPLKVLRRKLAEEGGFEPPRPEGPTVFETAAFNHSATPPRGPRDSPESGMGGIITQLFKNRRNCPHENCFFCYTAISRLTTRLSTEGCPSGLRSTIGNRVCGRTVPRVQIPIPPPATTHAVHTGRFFVAQKLADAQRLGWSHARSECFGWL